MAHALDTKFYSYMYDDVPENSFLARKHYIYIGSKQHRFSSKFNFYVINPLFKWVNNELDEIKEFIHSNNQVQNVSINTTLNKNITKIPALKPVQVLNYYSYTQSTSEINSSDSSNETDDLLSIITELKEKIDLLENKFDTTINNEIPTITELKNRLDLIENNFETKFDKIYNDIQMLFNSNLDSIYTYLKDQIEYTNTLTQNSVNNIENKVKVIEKTLITDTNNLFSQITKLNSIIANINKENLS